MRMVWLPILLFAVPCARAGVLTVGGTAGQFSTIQDAVNAAVDGDVILVKVDTTGGVTVDGKGVSIVADSPTQLQWSGYVNIRNVPAGRTVLVAGFDIQNTFVHPVAIADCAGAVRLQDLFLDTAGFQTNAPPSGIHCTSSADVAVTRGVIHGGAAAFPYLGAAAAFVTSSTIAFHDSALTGGRGATGGTNPWWIAHPGTLGGPGLFAGGTSVVFASGCVLSGGGGGTGHSGGVPAPWCTDPTNYPTVGGAGGAGVLTQDLAAGTGIANTVTGGVGGPGGVDPCTNQMPSGPNGQAVHVTGGSAWNAQIGVARTISLANLVRESTNLVIAFDGVPGDRVFLTSTMQPAHLPSTLLGGVFLGQGPYRRLEVGTLDSLGSLQISLPIADLGPGITNDARHLQCVMLDAAGQPRLGSSAMLVRLDSAW